MIRICADITEAAAGEYGESLNRGRVDQLVEGGEARLELALTGLMAPEMEYDALVAILGKQGKLKQHEGRGA